MPGLDESSSELMLLFLFASAVLWISYYINKDERALSGAAFASGFSILVAVLSELIAQEIIPHQLKKDLFYLLEYAAIFGSAAGVITILYSASSLKGIELKGVAQKKPWLVRNFKWVRVSIVIFIIYGYFLFFAGMGEGITALEQGKVPFELELNIGNVSFKIYSLLALVSGLMAFIQLHQLVRLIGEKTISTSENTQAGDNQG